MRAAVLVCLALAGAWCFGSSPAVAGGSHLQFEQESYAPGDTARARGWFGPGCCDRGWIHDGPYHAWITATDQSGAAVGERYPIGELVIEAVPYELAGRQHVRYEAVVEFEVPALAPGRYFVGHCNEPCTKELGDLIGGGFEIVSTVDAPPPDEAPPPVEAPPTPSAVASTTTTAPEALPAVGVRADATNAAIVESPSSSIFPWVAGAVALVLAGGVVILVVRRHRRGLVDR